MAAARRHDRSGRPAPGDLTHTVNEHVKGIYDKTGARTRGELSAMVFFGEHLPRIQSQVAVGDDASFVDAPRPRG